jgi:ribonuclease-3
VRREAPAPAPRRSFWSWFRSLFAPRRERPRERTPGAQEARVLAEFCRQFGLPFHDLGLLRLALTHRSYLSVTGQGPRESNERLEFLGDSVLGLVTSEFLYRRHPDEHEGQLTKTKSLLVSKAILSRRALRIGLGRFVLMSHSEVESGGRQRLSILADAFEAVIGAIYLDQGFESARTFIHKHLLEDSDAITADKRHTNYKSHLQEYVQNSFRTHPVYRIRSEFGPDHSKHFVVEVMVGRRTLGEGRGQNKKEAEQAAARDALEKVERLRRKVREDDDRAEEAAREGRVTERPGRGARAGTPARAGAASASEEEPEEEGPEERETVEAGDRDEAESPGRRRRSRRGGRRRHAPAEEGRHDAEPVPGEGARTRVRSRETGPVAVAIPVAPAGPPPAEPVHEPLVDPFESETDAVPGGERTVPVVDLPEPGSAASPEGERDARIDEMERALDNFGRRRSADYGRRGRRR